MNFFVTVFSNNVIFASRNIIVNFKTFFYTSQTIISKKFNSFYRIIYYFDLSGFPAGVLLIQSAMPSAILNYLVGSMYSPKKIVDSIASTIVTSTLMSFITIPIVVFFALRYFN